MPPCYYGQTLSRTVLAVCTGPPCQEMVQIHAATKSQASTWNSTNFCQNTAVSNSAYKCCSARPRAEFFIEPPPDTKRIERQGERGIWVAMSCYLFHVTPLPPSYLPTSPHHASVAPPTATLSGLAGGRRPPPSPTPPQQDYSQILATSLKVEDGLHLGACEYGS